MPFGQAPLLPQTCLGVLYLTLERIYCNLMGQTTLSRDQPSSAIGDGAFIVAEHQIGRPFSRVMTDIENFLVWSILREVSMSERVDRGKQHRTKLLRYMAALTEVICQTLDSEAKVERQLGAVKDQAEKFIELVEKANEADWPAIEIQVSQQLPLIKATANAYREAKCELKEAEANAIDLCSKVVHGVQIVEALLCCSVSRRLSGRVLPSEVNMAAPTGQGAQQLETLIKDVAALDQALNQIQVLQEKVKRLLTTSQADLTTILQQGTRKHNAVQGQQESEQLRMAANNMGALELAFYELKDAQILGARLADKVIKQVAATQSAMIVTESEGSKKMKVPEENVALLKKASHGLRGLQLNSALLDHAVQEFTVSAQSFLAAGREPTASQLHASPRGCPEIDLPDM